MTAQHLLSNPSTRHIGRKPEQGATQALRLLQGGEELNSSLLRLTEKSGQLSVSSLLSPAEAGLCCLDCTGFRPTAPKCVEHGIEAQPCLAREARLAVPRCRPAGHAGPVAWHLAQPGMCNLQRHPLGLDPCTQAQMW